MKQIQIFSMLISIALSACGQTKSQGMNYRLKGAPCEGCEAVFEYGNRKLKPVDTLPDYFQVGAHLKLTGRIYLADQKTPAKNVILYIYHTNQQGLYGYMQNAKGWEKRHGSTRGWIKTDSSGRYTFYTLLPGTYPSRSEPAHVHATLLEPTGKYYYLDEWHFKGDPLIYKLRSQKRTGHGGAGLVALTREGSLLIAKRDIILGLNVKDYE